MRQASVDKGVAVGHPVPQGRAPVPVTEIQPPARHAVPPAPALIKPDTTVVLRELELDRIGLREGRRVFLLAAPPRDETGPDAGPSTRPGPPFAPCRGHSGERKTLFFLMLVSSVWLSVYEAKPPLL